MRAINLSRVLGLAMLLVVLSPAVVQASEKAASPSVGALADITISFKLDPRLSGPTYGGERWVSPATYHGSAAQDTVDAKATGVGAKGEPVRISPKWIPADPEMVTVSPDQGDVVKIKVKRDGESRLRVTSEGISKELLIKAEHLPTTTAIQVHITPLKAAQTAAPGTQDSPATKTPAAEAKQDAPAFNSEQEKVSYALGVNVANSLRKQAIEVNQDALVRGYKDAVSGKTLLSPQDVQAILAGLRQNVRKNLEAQRADGSKGLAEKNKQAGEAFLAENKSKEGVVTLPSGLQYKVLTEGNGNKPALDDKVACNYRGTFLDGSEFDSTSKRRAPVTFTVASVIPGWREALQLMPVGSKWQLFIPSQLAYGARGTRARPRKKGAAPKQQVGPNATLIFELELLSIENSSATGSQRAQQDQNAAKDGSSAPFKEINQ